MKTLDYIADIQVGFFTDVDLRVINDCFEELYAHYPDYDYLELCFDFINVCFKLYGRKKIDA